MDYGLLLARAWRVVWNNKFMILLGFLVALGSGSQGFSANFGPDQPMAQDPEAFKRFFENIERFAAVGLLVVFLGLLLVVVFWLVRLVAAGGLIAAAADIAAGEERTLRGALGRGFEKLPGLAAISLIFWGPFVLVGGLVFLLAAITGFAGFEALLRGAPDPEVGAAFGSLGLIVVCGILLACLLAPIWLVLSLIYPFAQRGLVLGNLSPTAGIKHGWAFLRQNAGEVIILALIAFAGGIFFSAVAAAVLLPLALAAGLPAMMRMAEGVTMSAGDVLWLVLVFLIGTLIAAAVNSLYYALRSTAATLFYQELTAKGALPAEMLPEPGPAPM
ncbi:MAG: hypothetical protein ACRDHL_00445 [Candidatus Promineifilaceae bacterium]